MSITMNYSIGHLRAMGVRNEWNYLNYFSYCIYCLCRFDNVRGQRVKEEFSIMPDNPPYWRNYRFSGSHRHEVFFGTANRKKSIEDGLVIFLTPTMHNMSDKGIHFNRNFDIWAKRAAERAWLEYYGKTVSDFIQRYGKNFL